MYNPIDDESLLDDFLDLGLFLALPMLGELRSNTGAELLVCCMGMSLEGLLLGDLMCLLEEFQLGAREGLVLAGKGGLRALGGCFGLAEI